MEKKVYIAVVGIFVMFACCVQGCQIPSGVMNNNRYRDDGIKVRYSTYVIYGQVTKNVTGNYQYTDISGIYAAEVEVLCSYKGQSIPSPIIVTGLGNLNNEMAECPAATMNGSDKGVFFLNKLSGNVYETQFSPNTGAIEVILDDLTINCGLELTEDSDELCQDYLPLEAGECYEPPTSAAPPTTQSSNTSNDDSVEVDGGNSEAEGEGYETHNDNKDDANENANAEAEESSDPTGGASILAGSVFACLSAIILALINVL